MNQAAGRHPPGNGRQQREGQLMKTIGQAQNNRILVIERQSVLHADFKKFLGGSGAAKPGLQTAESICR